jgi:2-(1,2-epoxy-1,2-dihydrophenyl)acetyl-CoA isomerase
MLLAPRKQRTHVAEQDTGTDDLVVNIADGVAVLTLNRPERSNALSSAMLDALEQALRSAEADDQVGAVVLTGNGRNFCAGGDVKTMAAGESQIANDVSPHSQTVAQQQLQRATTVRLWGMLKPTIAALPGAAAGAGLALALSCDLRYAVARTRLVTGFARVGLAGDFGCSWLLNNAVGASRAQQLLYFSEPVSAEQALQWGLVNEIFEPEQLMTETLARARALAGGPGLALRCIKQNVRRAMNSGLAESADAEAVNHVQLIASEDHHEATRAFVEKRDPIFIGR